MKEIFQNPWVSLLFFSIFSFIGANLFYRELKNIKTKEDIINQVMRFFTSSSMLWPGILMIIVSLFFLGNFFKLL